MCPLDVLFFGTCLWRQRSGGKYEQYYDVALQHGSVVVTPPLVWCDGGYAFIFWVKAFDGRQAGRCQSCLGAVGRTAQSALSQYYSSGCWLGCSLFSEHHCPRPSMVGQRDTLISCVF